MKREELNDYRNSFSEEVINEIAELYDSGEKVTKIIEQFDLAISPSQITYFLPEVDTEHFCPYCGIPMQKRRSRQSGWYVSRDVKCNICGHVYSNHYTECSCENCRKKKIAIEENKRQIIYRNYSEIIPEEKNEFSSLGFEKQCFLYILYCEAGKYDEYDYLSHEAMSSKVVWKLVKRLLDTDILYVSPDSPISAFGEEDFPYRFYSRRVNYVINVSFTESDIRSISNRIFSAEGASADEIREVTHELMYEDLLMEFEKLLSERKIGFEPTSKQLNDFRVLLNELSYTQIRYLCYKVATFYSDRIMAGKIYKSKAPQQVLASVMTFYCNSMKKYGTVFRSDVEYVGRVLRYYIEHVLKKDISILNEVL